MAWLTLLAAAVLAAPDCALKPLLGGELPSAQRLCSGDACAPEFVAYAAAYADSDKEFRKKFPVFAGKRVAPQDLEKSPFSRAAALKGATDVYLGDRLRWKYAADAYAALSKRCDDPGALAAASEALAQLERGGEAAQGDAGVDAVPRLRALGAAVAGDLDAMRGEIRRLQAADREKRDASVATGSKDMLKSGALFDKQQLNGDTVVVAAIPAGPGKPAAASSDAANGPLRTAKVPAGEAGSYGGVSPEVAEAAPPPPTPARSAFDTIKASAMAAWKAAANYFSSSAQTAKDSWHGGAVVPVNVKQLPEPEK